MDDFELTLDLLTEGLIDDDITEAGDQDLVLFIDACHRWAGKAAKERIARVKARSAQRNLPLTD